VTHVTVQYSAKKVYGASCILPTVQYNTVGSPKNRPLLIRVIHSFQRALELALKLLIFFLVIVNTGQPRFRRCFSGLILTRKKIIAKHFWGYEFSPHMDRLKASRPPCDARGGDRLQRYSKKLRGRSRALSELRSK
jgi:hypothetical protein